MISRRERLFLGLRVIAIGHLVVLAIWFHGARLKGQSPEVLGERLAGQSERIARLESTDADARLRVLENDMAEVKYLGRGVALAMAVQLATGILGFVDRKKLVRHG